MRTAHAVALRHARSFVSAGRRLLCSYRFLAFHVDPFWTQLLYFLCLALLGSAALMALEPSDPTFSPKYVDMLYLSASAVTVSGLATVEMEVLSQSQVLVYTLLMLLGGEVWVSFLGILVRLPKLATPAVTAGGRVFDHMPRSVDLSSSVDPHDVEGAVAITLEDLTATVSTATEYRCLRLLAYVVFAYMALIQVGGSLLIFLYISIVSSNSKAVLEGKGIRVLPFAVSVTISSFANGGLIPTNENMAVFRKNSAMLLLMALQVLAGNTLFPVLLRAVVLGLKALTGKTEFEHMVKSPTRVRYFHLMPGRRAWSLGLTVGGLLSAQVALFCALDWRTRVLAGLGWFQKIAAALFQAANTRHAGEAAFDLSAVSPATLVLFVVMMYLPAYTSFLPVEEEGSYTSAAGQQQQDENKKRAIMSWVSLSQHSYVVIFVIVLCIIERKKMAEDPLNFSVLNVVFETTSAYGNVGLSLGYSCARQIKPDGICKDAWYGFSGRFTSAGKLMVVFIMFFGRLKKSHMGGGKAWKLM